MSILSNFTFMVPENLQQMLNTHTVHFGVPCVEIQPLHVTPDLQATTRLCRKDIEKVKEVD